MSLCVTGQPVAWCISDQENTEVIELFLRSIQQRSPEAKVSVLMTDDGLCMMQGLFSYNILIFFAF